MRRPRVLRRTRNVALQTRLSLAALGCGALLALGLPGAAALATPVVTCGGAVTCFSESGSIVTYEVTASGLYDITAWGAQGGNASLGPIGGDGAEIGGEFNLTAGTTFDIAVGQQGQSDSSLIAGGGGGGGSFVVETVGGTATPLVIAGGGGGGGGGTGGSNGDTGQAGQNATAGGSVIDTPGGAPVSGGFGGFPGGGQAGGGGGGFNSIGGGTEGQLVGGGGGDFADGLYAGEGANGANPADGGSNGGFGGGGGGGGGYSFEGLGTGGGGGGGSSYIDAALVLPDDQIDLGGVNAGDGFITFDLVQAAESASVPEPGSVALIGVGLVALGLLKRAPRPARRASQGA